VVVGDQPLLIELKHRVNDVVHQAPGRTEPVVGFPMRLAAVGVGRYAAAGQLPDLAPGLGRVAQHAPHAADLFVAAQRKGLVMKLRIRGIEAGHGVSVQAGKRRVEVVEPGLVGMHAESSDRG
jgi:hypothetical protein